jgi:hypothetical protein
MLASRQRQAAACEVEREHQVINPPAGALQHRVFWGELPCCI